MSKKILFFAVLFSLVISIAVTQEASALTIGYGQSTRTTTASLGPSKTCGDHICRPGESSKWSYAVMASQRQGSPKATGGYIGMVIMHQLVVNSQATSNHVNSVITHDHQMDKMHNSRDKMHGSMGNMTSPLVNATGP
jgi:hypothetical protein